MTTKLLDLEDNIDEVQGIVGHSFDNEGLLYQAFTRRSYSQENGGYNNETLELIGDRVLDLFVTKIITDKYGYIDYDEEDEFGFFGVEKYDNEGKITDLKKKLVNKTMLAHRIDLLKLNKYLIMGNGDINSNKQDEESVKEDLFESILGAIAVDTNWDFGELENSVSLMLNIDHYLSHGFKSEDKDFVTLLQQWNQKENDELPEYDYTECEDGSYICDLEVDTEEGVIYDRANGYSKGEARAKVAKKIYKYLEKHDLLFTMRDEVPEELDCENAIQSLNKLSQRGYIKTPVYVQDYETEYDSDGNPRWTCRCYIPNSRIDNIAYDSTKKGAKQYSAYLALCDIFHMDDIYDDSDRSEDDSYYFGEDDDWDD